MTLKQFIKEHRVELKEAVEKQLNFVPKTASCSCYLCGRDHIHRGGKTISDSELRLWVLNDEGLYRWARSEGVKI